MPPTNAKNCPLWSVNTETLTEIDQRCRRAPAGIFCLEVKRAELRFLHAFYMLILDRCHWIHSRDHCLTSRRIPGHTNFLTIERKPGRTPGCEQRWTMSNAGLRRVLGTTGLLA